MKKTTVKQVVAKNGVNLATTVKCFVLNGCSRLTDRGLALIARRCKSLEQLNVQYCTEITNGGLLGKDNFDNELTIGRTRFLSLRRRIIYSPLHCSSFNFVSLSGFLYRFIALSLSIFICLSFYISLSLFLSLSLSVSSLCLSLFLSLSLSVCQSVSSLCLSYLEVV